MRIGVDLGGTKIEAIALDEAGRECMRQRVSTPRDDYDGIIRAVAGLVETIESTLGTRATVGVGTPGSVSRATGLLRNSNSVCLNGKPLQADLESRLQRSIRLANDANCFALSEATDGGGAGAAVVFGVILGTGVGGGLVLQGQVIDGPNGITGEWGHNRLPDLAGEVPTAGALHPDLPTSAANTGHWPPQLHCYCGRINCVETWLSGPGLAADHARVNRQTLTAHDIARAAEMGDAAACATLDRHARRLARALAVLINILDPDVIVLGGGLSNLASLYEQVPRLWQPHVFSDRIDTRLVPNRHGDSSGVRGAAWLWPAAGPTGFGLHQPGVPA